MTPNVRRGSRISQQILDVVFPTRTVREVGGAANPPRLEQASSVAFLKSHGEPGVPGIEESDLPPVPRGFDLRIGLGDRIGRVPEPTQS